MNRDDEFTHAIEAWLRRKAPPQAPDRVLETALERVNSESQRQSWQQRLFGTTAMGSLLRVAAVTAVVALAVLAGQQLSNLVPDVGESSPSPSISASSPSTSPSASPSADCVNPPVDITSLIDVEDPVACYGNAPITIDAEVIAGIADCPIVVEPAWLSCPQTFLMLVGETRKVGAPMLSVAVDPASGVSMGAPNTDVRVTGHFDDPAAQTCRETERLEVGGTPEPAKLTIEFCRRIFVVTQVVPLAVGVPNVLGPDAFAHVVAGSVNVRTEPGLDAPRVGIAMADAEPLPAVLGTETGSEHVYILEGPVEADGFDWYRVAPIEYEGYGTVGPLFIGWMAAGDGTDPWLVVENPCPEGPMTLADLTYSSTTTNWATRLGCFRGQELTLRGWFTELPPDWETSGPCETEPAYFYCTYAAYDIRPVEMSFYDERNANRLDFVVTPGSGVVMPSRGQWIEITGHWDDTASALCPTGGDLGTLFCRIQFVVTSVQALGPEG